jgi:ketosteroid isomerase-like protein
MSPLFRFTAAALLVTAFTACASTPKGTATMDTATEQLKNAEQTWVRALVTGSPDLLAGLVDDEFSFIGPDGQFEDREAYLAGYRALPSQGVSVQSVDLDDVKIRLTGDTGVVTGRAVAKVTFQSQHIVEDVRFTRVYQRRGTGWRMIAGQGTRLAQQPPG